MKANVELITPDSARELLLLNTMNRNAKPSTIDEYARQMVAGLWKEATGESIKISDSGVLLDGQQRLNALIKANKSLTFLVIRDLDNEIFKVIDQGVKRSPGDVFHIAGINYSILVSSGIRRYWNLQRGMKQISNVRCLSSSEAMSLYRTRPHFWDAAAEMSNGWYKKSRVLSKSDYCGLYALFFDLEQDAAFNFMDSLATGLNLNSNNPIMVLREKLIGNLISGYKLTEPHRIALIYKTWNYFRKDSKVTHLYLAKNEAFPIPT
jgi:hypothetical protein